MASKGTNRKHELMTIFYLHKLENDKQLKHNAILSNEFNSQILIFSEVISL